MLSAISFAVDDDELANLYSAKMWKKRINALLEKQRENMYIVDYKFCKTILISAGKLIHAAGSATANARSPSRDFDICFGLNSLTAVDAEVKVDINDDCNVETLSDWMAVMHM